MESENKQSQKDIKEQIINYIEGENCNYESIPSFLRSRIEFMKKNYNEDDKDEIESYVTSVICPLICLFSGKNEDDKKYQNQTENTQDNQKDNQEEFNIDEELENLSRKSKDGIDTSTEEFQKIINKYKVFFRTRCENIVKDAKEKKADIELREFMIRHNRFVPLFNLRHIPQKLLGQMAERFSRMKKDPEDIQKEYDKIELTTTEIK